MSFAEYSHTLNTLIPGSLLLSHIYPTDTIVTNTNTIELLEKKTVEFAQSLVQELQTLKDQHHEMSGIRASIHSQELVALRKKHQEDLDKQRQESKRYYSKLIEEQQSKEK